jgi:hypothetical protein
MEIKVECGNCGQHVAVDDSAVGQVFACPACGQSLSVPLPARVVSQQAPSTQANLQREIQTNVKQGAAIGGWVCFAAGVVFMFIPFPTWFIYAPLFFASFILGIIAIAQKRIASGITLLLANVVGGPILFLIAIAIGLATWTGAFDRARQRAEEFSNRSATNSASQSSTTSSYPELDARNGFREFTLGTYLSRLAGLKPEPLMFQNTDEKTFSVERFDKTLGNFEISKVILTFDSDLLKEITVYADGRANVAGLKETLTAAYGTSKEEGFISEDLVWRGSKVVLRFHTMDADSAYATFTSKEVEDTVKSEADRKAKEGARDAAKHL